MKISVIIPIFNVGNYLDRCLNSLLTCKTDDFEIVLVNDGSTDNSKAVCENYEKKYNNIKLINKKNSGTGNTRNVGLLNAKGEYIYFCDPDDYVEDFFLDKILEFIKSKKDVYMFGFWEEIEYKQKLVYRNERSIFEGENFNRIDFFSNFSDLFFSETLYNVWNKLYKRSFLMKYNLKFGTASMGQDTRFNINVYRNMNNFKVIPETYYHYNVSREGSSTTKFRKNRMILKMEENDLWEKLLEEFSVVERNEIIQKNREAFLIDCGNHIANSELSFKEKKEALLEMLTLFDSTFSNFIFLKNKLSILLLKKRYLVSYLLLKKIQSKKRKLKYTIVTIKKVEKVKNVVF